MFTTAACAVICPFVSLHSLSADGSLMGALPCLSSREPPGADVSCAPLHRQTSFNPVLPASTLLDCTVMCSAHLSTQASDHQIGWANKLSSLDMHGRHTHTHRHARAHTHTITDSRCPALPVLNWTWTVSRHFLMRLVVAAINWTNFCGVFFFVFFSPVLAVVACQSYLYSPDLASEIPQTLKSFLSNDRSTQSLLWEETFLYPLCSQGNSYL